MADQMPREGEKLNTPHDHSTMYMLSKDSYEQSHKYPSIDTKRQNGYVPWQKRGAP